MAADLAHLDVYAAGHPVSNIQLPQPKKRIQGFRVRESILILYRTAVHHIAHGQFNDLAGFGPGYVRHCNHLCRDVARRSTGANAAFDCRHQIGRQRCTFGQAHEQYDANIIVPAPYPPATESGNYFRLAPSIRTFEQTFPSARSGRCGRMCTVDRCRD